jgi:hypothetical protein
MSKDIKFETRNSKDCIVIAEYKGTSEGATLCYWADDCSLVVWNIHRYDDWKSTLNGDYFPLDGTQNLAEMLDHPTRHNEKALVKAKLRLVDRMYKQEDLMDI